MQRFCMKEFNRLMGQGQGYFSWLSANPLDPLIRALKGAYDSRRGDDWRMLSDQETRVVQTTIHALLPAIRTQYDRALSYLAGELNIFKSPEAAAAAFNPMRELYEDPDAFLRHNVVVIAGGRESGERVCFIGRHITQPDPRVPRASPFGVPAVTYRISVDNQSSTAQAPIRSFQAHNIRMIPGEGAFNPAAIEPYILDTSGHPLMVTTQLSGCSFVVREHGARLVVAHVQPDVPGTPLIRGDGNQLHDRLVQDGRFVESVNFTNARYGVFTGAPFTTVFGRRSYGAMKANIIGLRRQGTWQIYAQLFSSAGASIAIESVTRIVPPMPVVAV